MRAITTSATIILLLVLLPALAHAQPKLKPQPSPTPGATPPQTTASSPQKQTGEEVDAEDVIKVTTNLVTSNALVIGRDRKFVPSMKREDFHIFEDGVEQQIAYFASVDRPFNVALVIDNSHSTAFELRYIKEAAIAFVNQMRPDDRAVIILPSGEFDPNVAPSSDHHELVKAIWKIETAGATRLYDAVDFAVNHALAKIEGRKAVILLTDGVDNDSRDASYQTNLNDVANSNVQIYAVEFSTSEDAFKQASRIPRPAPEGSGFSRVDYQRADAYLHQMAELTGTSVFPAATLTDLDSAVAKISEELHNEYTLGYYPRVAGKQGEIRRLEVRVNQTFLNVRARTTYSFGPASSDKSANAQIAMAPLSEIESRSPFRSVAESKRPLDARWVCKGPFVPGDFALVQEGFDVNCPPSARPNDQTNAWLIRKPGASEMVCKGYIWRNGAEVEIMPIPAGFVVVGEATSPVCSQSINPKQRANAWNVQRPSSETTVCKGFLIPQGFVIVNEKTATVCPATERAANAWIIVPKWDIETRRLWQVP